MESVQTISKFIAKVFLFFAFISISAVWAAEGVMVPYLDENGETQYCENPVELNNDTDISVGLPGGWYVVKGKVSYSHELKFHDDVHLILADGAELSSVADIMVHRRLFVYAQSTGEQMGKMFITSGEEKYSLNANRDIIINGGFVIATSINKDGHISETYGLISKRGNIVVNGGRINVAGYYGFYAGNKIYINGGNVTVDSCGKYGIHAPSRITINGGSVTKNGGYVLDSYDIIINGGSVTGNLKSKAKVTINDGNVTLADSGLYAEQGVTINGGRVTAMSREYYARGGLEIGYGSILINGGYVNVGNFATRKQLFSLSNPENCSDFVFGYSDVTDSIKVGYIEAISNRFVLRRAYACIAEDQVLKDENGNLYSGVLLKSDIFAMRGKTLTPYNGHTLKFVTGDANVVVPAQGVAVGKNPTKPVVFREGFELVGWFTDESFTTEFDFTKPLEKNTTVYAKWNNLVKVSYIDENGKSQEISEYFYLSESANIIDTLPAGWYVVKGKVNFKNQLRFKGDVHLILADNSELLLEDNPNLYDVWGDYLEWTGNIDILGSLTVYVQSTGRQVGKLIAANIKARNKITINGGRVTATDKEDGCGLDANDTITLGYSSATDSLKICFAMYLNVRIAEGQVFKDEKGNVYSGFLTNDEKNAINNKTLTPYDGLALKFVTGGADVVVPTQGIAVGKTPTKPTVSCDAFELVGWFTDESFTTEFDFSKPLEKVTVIYAKWRTPYLDEKGETQYCESPVAFNPEWYGTLSGGCYVVKGKVDNSGSMYLNAKGDVDLILADGADWSISAANTIYVSDGSLTIYTQSAGEKMGKLSVDARSEGSGFHASENITIVNGNIKATIGRDGKGFYAEQGNIAILGGNINTSFDENGNGFYAKRGNISVFGGDVTITIRENGNGLYAESGDISISGGNVTATVGGYGTGFLANSYAKRIILGYSSATDRITASSFSGQVWIADGQALIDEEGYGYSDSLSKDEMSTIAGKTLVPAYALTFVTNDINVAVPKQGVAVGKTPTEPTITRDGYELVGWYTDEKFTTKFDFSKPLEKNTTIYAKWNNLVKVAYIDENGKSQEQSEYFYLKETANISDVLPGGWYVVKGKVDYTNILKFDGDVHLILADSAELSVEVNDSVCCGVKKVIDVMGNLTVYAQSLDEKMGKLYTKTRDCGLYVNKDLTINGGDITATETNYGLYVNEGNFTINGGSVTATAKNDGIFVGKGDLTINDGDVIVTAGNKGILAYKDFIINGGHVTVTADQSGVESYNGKITVNDGLIMVNAGKHGLYANQEFIVNGGDITATAESEGLHAENSNFTINSGVINATGGKYSYGIEGGRGLTINGGCVTATGGIGGVFAYTGSLVLGLKDTTGSIKASSYNARYIVQIAEGLVLKDENGNFYSGTLSYSTANALAGKTLKFAYASSDSDMTTDFAPVVAFDPKIIYADGLLSISAPQASNVKVEVFDLMGNLVTKSLGHADKYAVSLSHLKRGAYVARVTTGHAVRSLRFLIK